MGNTSDESRSTDLQRAIARLEQRIAHIEEHLALPSTQEELNIKRDRPSGDERSFETNEALENQIGGNLFSRLAILVLALGIAFLLTFPFQGLPAVLPSLVGYTLVAAAWILSYRWRESLPQLSGYILAGAMLLLYFTTLRLSFFSANRAIESKALELILLLVTVVISTLVSFRRRSPYLFALSLTAGYATALIGDDSVFLFLLCLALVVAAVLLARQHRWHSLLLFATCATYITQFVWAIGNPVAGHEIHLVALSPVAVFFTVLNMVVLAAGTLFRDRVIPEEGIIVVSSFVNAVAGYGTYVVMVIALQSHPASWYHVAASVVLLTLSMLFWNRERSRYATFVYAMVGYMALSVALITGFPGPDYFVWLACQSVLVISTAVWFRSRFIIGANVAIFLLLFVAYLFVAGTVSIVSIMFGLVALLSARILNWKKDRLELRTEMMRNAYLASAFFIIPYALYHTVPTGYVSISWVLVAVFYFGMSILLNNNRKYRWMALLTLCLTIGYVFLVDIRNLDPLFRIVSLLVLGIALFWISVRYTRRRTSSPPHTDTQPETIDQTIHEP